jgi:ribosome assembly protein YihI (activator of Der GTPase)
MYFDDRSEDEELEILLHQRNAFRGPLDAGQQAYATALNARIEGLMTLLGITDAQQFLRDRMMGKHNGLQS